LERIPDFTLFTGIAGSGKTTALLDLYRDALRRARSNGKPGTTLWLSPTNRAQAEIRARLLDDSLNVVFRPNLFTFDQFADEVLKAAPQPVTPCSAAMQRVLLRRVVAELTQQKRLRHFREIARTAGFLDLVSAFIAELKRSETWPEKFAEACSDRGSRTADQELELIYRRYQELLQSANVYDGEGRFWSARQALAEGLWGRFGDLSLAVIDGFTDFTEAQFKILELVAQHVGKTCVSLLIENSPARSDLFAKTAAVRSRLQKIGQLEILEFPLQSAVAPLAPPAGGTPTAPTIIAKNLFINPRDIVPSSAAEGVDVVAVAGRTGEVRCLAARVKRLLLDGIAPDEIVVAVRDLDDYAVLFEEIFSAAGLPFACEAGAAASRLAPVKALVNLLSLETEDWPFQRLLAFLDSGHFQPDWSEFADRRAVRDVSAQLRRHQLAEGREPILATLERMARQPAEDDESIPIASPRRACLLLTRLSEALAELRRKHDLTGWSSVIARLIREIGLDRAPLDVESTDSDRTFGGFLTSILFDASRGEQVTGIEHEKLGLADFLCELTDLLDHQRLPPRRSEAGRVRVLSAEQVRNLEVPYLFLAGLSETSFPQHRSDDCLYSERDRQELNECGLSLGHRAVRSQEELLMFYGVVTRARKRLVMTYPKVTEEGQPLSCSPFLSSIRELFDEAALPEQLDEKLDPVPDLDRVLSPADYRVRGMSEALAGHPGLFRGVCEAQPSARHSLAAIDMNVRRFHTRGFTNYEGLLDNARNIEWIRNRFSPEHDFSATQFEAYAECPFKFLIGHVLKLELPSVPGIETDHARRGSLVHELLAEMHRKILATSTSASEPPEVPRGEDVAAAFRELLDARLKTRPTAGSVHQALERIEQRLMAEWGDAYGRQWDAYVATLPPDAARPPLPALFETAFGNVKPAAVGDSHLSDALQDAASAKSTDGSRSEPAALGPTEYPPLVFGAGGREVRVGGRIDRIDVGHVDGQAVFTVIDYKTGRNFRDKIDNVDSGRSLQLELYALAAANLEIAGPGAKPWQMGYWFVRETGFLRGIKSGKVKPGEPLPPIAEGDWSAVVDQLSQTIVRLASGIRSGRFPVYNLNEDCTSGCPYNTICRVGQIRNVQDSLQKIPQSGSS
jgi:superfamily I DNA/RNA helicase